MKQYITRGGHIVTLEREGKSDICTLELIRNYIKLNALKESIKPLNKTRQFRECFRQEISALIHRIRNIKQACKDLQSASELKVTLRKACIDTLGRPSTIKRSYTIFQVGDSHTYSMRKNALTASRDRLRSLREYNRPKIDTDRNKMLKRLKKRQWDKVWETKHPKTLEQHVAVEIEFISHLNQDEIVEKVLAHKLQNFLTLKEDGSLRTNSSQNQNSHTWYDEENDCDRCDSCDSPDYDDCGCFSENLHGHEFAVIAPVSERDNIIFKTCALLRDVDATVNESCGLHVHIDARPKTKAEKVMSRGEIIFNNLSASQSLLMAMQPIGRRDNTYCKRVKSRLLLRRDRYHAVNSDSYFKFKTIEVRCHTGTTDQTKISQWVNLLLNIGNAPKIDIFPRSLKSVQSKFDLKPDTLKYIDTRLRKFNSGDKIPFISKTFNIDKLIQKIAA